MYDLSLELFLPLKGRQGACHRFSFCGLHCLESAFRPLIIEGSPRDGTSPLSVFTMTVYLGPLPTNSSRQLTALHRDPATKQQQSQGGGTNALSPLYPTYEAHARYVSQSF